MDDWYSELEQVKSYIVIQDPKLKIVFEAVDAIYAHQ